MASLSSTRAACSTRSGRGPDYSAFPLSLILAGENRYLERWPRPVRRIVPGATLAAMFGFFLAVTLVAERF